MTCQMGPFTLLSTKSKHAMETVLLKQVFFHCRLISYTYSVSPNRNQMTLNYRCCGSLISEFIKF